MKKYYIIIVFLIVSNVFSQNKKYDTILFKNIQIDGHEVLFKYKNIRQLEKYFGTLTKKEKFSEYEKEKLLTIQTKDAFKYSNAEVSLAIIRDYAFVYYFNFDVSKKKLLLSHNGKKIILSGSFKLSQFKTIFPNSYKNASGLPIIPFDRAAGVSLVIKDKNKKSYLNLAFYDGNLSSVIFSNNLINMRD
ncbi:hypothetical protein [Flavobacterium aquidurense]|uniref:Uncharacterized protein n=1 Tax=Flavobacterium aquidurense TaxID=362413 RepID=A0A0Q0S4M6_9FLAO|nr:hypothetical protein [Flavobacterium aquidurense]KQB40458.1 hypothetical protein RC62_348 [Flavobacterium aquidurense]